jgi:hypothetical protein
MKRTTFAAVALLSFAGASRAAAQQAPADFPERCTYDACALRIQAPSLTTARKLVRGSESVDVVPLGLLQPAVAPFVQLSDSAFVHATSYDELSDRGAIISLAGTAMTIIAPIVMRGTMQKIAFTGVGIGISVIGGMISNRADDALSRAIWHYNRELPR